MKSLKRQSNARSHEGRRTLPQCEDQSGGEESLEGGECRLMKSQSSGENPYANAPAKNGEMSVFEETL